MACLIYLNDYNFKLNAEYLKNRIRSLNFLTSFNISYRYVSVLSTVWSLIYSRFSENTKTFDSVLLVMFGMLCVVHLRRRWCHPPFVLSLNVHCRLLELGYWHLLAAVCSRLDTRHKWLVFSCDTGSRVSVFG